MTANMESKQGYDEVPNFAMWDGRSWDLLLQRGPLRYFLTFMDNLSLIAGLEIYGVESITHTHTHTYHAAENAWVRKQRKCDEGPITGCQNLM